MKNFTFPLLFITAFISSCEWEKIEPIQSCLYSAVVEDHSDLDGCGYLFKLENGEYLEPVWRWGWCATPPLPEGYESDPLKDFRYEHGKKVKIGFEYTNDYGSSTCMKGKMVIITCIEDLGEGSPAGEQ